MHATIQLNNKPFKIDLSKPIDLSITLSDDGENPLAWYLEKPEFEPVKSDNWVGKVSEGAAVNFIDLKFNPHAHGTHTECLGHITKEFHSVNDSLKSYFFLAEVISVLPENLGEDQVLSTQQIKVLLEGKNPEALVIRTLPNTNTKKSKNYSNTNWPYLQEKAAVYLREKGVQHLLIDLPSVDKEKDNGILAAHHAFWNIPKEPRKKATITELIYVPDTVKDGSYLLNLQMANINNDAAPSRPVLYKFI